MAKRSTSKRKLIDTGKNKMYAKRTAKGRFKEMDHVGRSLSADRRRSAKKKTRRGMEIRETGHASERKRGRDPHRKPMRVCAAKLLSVAVQAARHPSSYGRVVPLQGSCTSGCPSPFRRRRLILFYHSVLLQVSRSPIAATS